MSMNNLTNMLTFSIILMLIGALVTIMSYNVLPTIIQSGNDLVDDSVSGVNLTTSQQNLVTSNQNITILLFLYIGIIVLIVGFVILIYSGFKGVTGK